MCGLFGWQLSEEAMAKGDVHTLAVILAANSDHRGNESWGVCMVTPGQKPVVIKNTGSIKKTCRIKDIIAPQVIGHTRKGTTGAITQENAHPFMHGKIIGAHNGFVYEHEKLNKEYKRNFNVDSQHLIAHIAEGKPLKDLGGQGTVSYLNTDNPESVFLGRGASSDLTVFGIGPRNKPIGIIWCSTAYWGNEALDMAGFSDNFVITTNIRTLYRITMYECFDHEEFDFGPSYQRVRAIHQNDTREIGGVGATSEYSGCYSPYSGNKGYRGTTQFDTTHYNKNKEERKSVTSISKSELDTLPEHLKKNPEKCDVPEGETTQVGKADLQCHACGDWGPLVTSFESNAEGIMYFSTVDQDLCLACAMFWGDESGAKVMGAVQHVMVPKLTILLPHRKDGGLCEHQREIGFTTAEVSSGS